MKRRVVLMSLGALGALVGCPQRLPRERLSFDEFVDELVPLAEASAQRGVGDQAHYVRTLSRRLDDVTWSGLEHAVDGILVKRHPVVISLLEIRAGDAIPTHDHRGYTAVMHVLSGNPVVQSYDYIEEPAWPSQPNLRRVKPRATKRLSPGDTAITHAGEANIHGIRADDDQDARLVDIFTLYRPDAHSRVVELLGEESDGTFHTRLGRVL